MADIVIDRSDAEIKVGIEKASDLESSASEIDEATDYYKANNKPDSIVLLNGVDSEILLDKTYTLSNDGDFLEFTAKWNNLQSLPADGAGLFGVKGDANTTLGYVTATSIYIRGATSEWMIFSGVGTVVTPTLLNKYKFIVNGANLDLYLNDVYFKSAVYVSPLSIDNIGQAYSSFYVSAGIKSISIKSGVDTLISTDLFNDVRLNNINTTNTIIPKVTNDYLKINIIGGILEISKKQPSGNYVTYKMERIVDVVKNVDVFRITKASLSNSELSTLRVLTNDGEWENAIKFDGDDDFVGGSTHGNEIITTLRILVDGKEIDLNVDATFETKRLTVLQYSTMFIPNPLVNEGAEIVKSSKQWEYNFNTPNKLGNQCTFLGDINVSLGYLFMMPILREDENGLITENLTVSPLFDNIDVSIAAHSNPYYRGSEFYKTCVINSNTSGVSASFNVTKGWINDLTCVFNVSPSSTYNKCYFDFIHIRNMLTGEVVETEVEFDIKVNI